MQRKLHISNDLSLPIDAVTQTFADLGIRGSGKTNTATVMFEEMQKLGQQACVIDPVNAWYGVRSSKDGKSPGFKVIVMGGENGDLPLEGSNGSLLADFVIESGASVVFSLRHLSMNDQRQFAQGFAERLYFLKGKSENRSPLHLFVDEADEFIPQRIPKGFERMFGAFDRLVRRGRSSGIGLTMISQRPQVLNKDTLSQCETLICHRLLRQLDRKAVESWIMAHADASSALEFWQSLATLGKGDAWVWSPEWMDIFKRVHIRARETFDSSFTPKAGERPKTVSKLAEVDLDELKKKLSATIEKAKQDDPRELKREIAELKKQMSKQPTGQPRTATGKVIEKPSAADRATIRRLRQGLEQAMKIIANISAIGFDDAAIKPEEIKSALDKASAEITRLAEAGISRRLRDFDNLKRSAETLLKRLERLESGASDENPELNISVIRNEPVTVTQTRKPVQPRLVTRAASNGHDSLPPGERAVMFAVAQFGTVEREQLAVLTGYKRSSRDAYISRLAARGHITITGRVLSPTQSGVDVLGSDYEPLPTGSELYDYWQNRLPAGERKVLAELHNACGDAVDKDTLMESTGFKRSSLDAYLSRLAAKRLVESPGARLASASQALFD